MFGLIIVRLVGVCVIFLVNQSERLAFAISRLVSVVVPLDMLMQYQVIPFTLAGNATLNISPKQGHEFHIEVSVNTRERYFRADAFDEDPYVAADMALVKLERQFLKNRKVVQNHRRPEFSKQGRLEQMNDRFESPLRYRKAA